MALSSTLFCDRCGAANRAQAIFCSACGRSLHISANGTISKNHTTLLVQQDDFNKRYRIMQQIGKGGFGSVYKAADTQFADRPLAIKKMSQNNLNPQELREATEAFKREAHLLASLTHPNLPRIYEQFSDTDRLYLVMDYIEGETLEAYLDKMGGKLPVDKVLTIGIQLTSVLEYLHTHRPPIIFRDLKPANVMLTADNHIFLIDFGIARLFKPGQAKDTTALGSLGYAAPEQYGKAQTTPRTDIYSLGVTLHQMLSGDDPTDSPFHFAPLQLHGYPLLADLVRLIAQMLEVDSSKRPAAVSEIKQKLQHIYSLYTVAQTNPLPQQSTLPHGSQALSAAPPPQTHTPGPWRGMARPRHPHRLGGRRQDPSGLGGRHPPRPLHLQRAYRQGHRPLVVTRRQANRLSQQRSHRPGLGMGKRHQPQLLLLAPLLTSPRQHLPRPHPQSHRNRLVP